MREKTLRYREAAYDDLAKISHRNNSRLDNMTDEKKKQSRDDKIRFYSNRWLEMKEAADTPAQKKWCDVVLRQLERISRK